MDVGGNLFLSDAKAGVGVIACSGTIGVNSFSSNAFVNAAGLVIAGNCSTGQLNTITAVESHYASSAVHGATGNRRVSASCGSSDSATQCAPVATCVSAQASQSACIAHVLGTWDDTTQGSADLLDNSRTWKLATTAPCTIAQAYSTPLTDVLDADGGTTYDTIDILGAQRTAPVTIGAYEDNGTCAP